MRTDASLDDEIRTIERRIAERRLALHDSMQDLGRTAQAAKARVRERATSPIVWGGALAAGFIAARLARRRSAPPRRSPRTEKQQVSPGRQVMAAVLSSALPILLRVAQQSAGPWIARAVSGMHRGARARPYEGGRYTR
jgi:hypothetical protein